MGNSAPSRMRCLARIASLGGLARPNMAGPKYRLTLQLLEDDSGTPVDGGLETHFEDFDDRLEGALVDAKKIWVAFDPVEIDRSRPSGSSDIDEERLQVLDAENVQILWDYEDADGTECPDCDGDGEVDISVGPPRIVDCSRCDGTGTLDG